MAFDPTPEQRLKLEKGRVTLGIGAESVKVYGTIGTLEHFGWVPDAGALDLAQTGVTRTVARAAHSRSRWLGDSAGSSVASNTATVKFYPSRRGNALPGTPIKLRNIATGLDWTVQVDGEIGNFIAYLLSNRPPFDLKVIGKRGNPYDGVILSNPT
jgi:hypothetical protein